MTKTQTVIAFDPGVSTGVALRANGEYTTTTIKDDLPFIYSFFTHFPDVVVVERYAGITISKDGLYTVELVGGIKALCLYNNIKLIVHVPQFRLAGIHGAKLMLRGQQHTIHEVDALSHLLVWEELQEDK